MTMITKSKKRMNFLSKPLEKNPKRGKTFTKKMRKGVKIA